MIVTFYVSPFIISYWSFNVLTIRRTKLLFKISVSTLKILTSCDNSLIVTCRETAAHYSDNPNMNTIYGRNSELLNVTYRYKCAPECDLVSVLSG